MTVVDWLFFGDPGSVVAADCTGGHSRVKGAFGVGFADDGLAAVTLDPRASAALSQALTGRLAPALAMSAATTEPPA